MKRLFTLLAAGAFVSACGSSNNGGGGGNVVNVDPNMSESAIAAAFSGAAANSTIQMAAGTYHFANSVNLSTNDNITVKGAGMTSTILDFQNQSAGADGVVQSVPASSTVKVSFSDFSIQDTAGDGLKITGSSGLHVNHVGVSWPTRTTHGGYGIYPVQSKQVLVENCTVDGASDTGIYVGQSDGIVVRTNVLTHNVAGIEIENSSNADVTGNDSHDNTAGFLVFELPTLPKVGGHNIRVYSNNFHDNNTPNFGDPSGTVALVPAGTGGLVLAVTKVEVFGNTFTNNGALGLAIVSCYTAFGADSNSPCMHATSGYVAIPNSVSAHGNTYTHNGADPAVILANNPAGHPSNAFALLIASGFLPPGWAGGHVSDVSYDGVFPLGGTGNLYSICTDGTGGGSTGKFANLHLDKVAQGQTLSSVYQFDDPAFIGCTPQGFPLPAVPVPTF